MVSEKRMGKRKRVKDKNRDIKTLKEGWRKDRERLVIRYIVKQRHKDTEGGMEEGQRGASN